MDLAGKFIVLDGPDGCGKSTQVERLREWISSQGIRVASYRDPGTTFIGEKIRDILLDPAHEGMADSVEVLLYMAARAQLWKELIKTDLSAGKCVLMDRWISSTCAYQGKAGGFGVDKVIQLGGMCLERVWPDLTIILDVDLETANARMDRQLDRMELKGDSYHAKVRSGYLELADKETSICIVNACETVDTVQQRIIIMLKSQLDLKS